jgi:NAD(P) transhydrogenase
MEQAWRAVAAALDLPSKPFSTLLPNGIYTIPEVSMVGETEQSLKKKGSDYIVGRCSYGENPRGQIIGDKNGFLKLLFRKCDLRLVVVHVIGELATELVHTGLIAMMTDATPEIANISRHRINVSSNGAGCSYDHQLETRHIYFQWMLMQPECRRNVTGFSR